LLPGLKLEVLTPEGDKDSNEEGKRYDIGTNYERYRKHAQPEAVRRGEYNYKEEIHAF